MFSRDLKLGMWWIIILLYLLFFNSLSWCQTVLFNNKIDSDGTERIHNEEQIVISPTNPNNIVAIWRDFRVGYRQVGIGYSTDGGENWKDTLIGFQVAPYPWESDPTLTVDRVGNFYAVTLCFKPLPVDTSALCFYKSTDGGASWGTPTKIVDSVAFEDKTMMTCDQTGGTYDGNLYLSWNRFDDVSPESSGIFFSFSTNAGLNWSTPKKMSFDGYWTVPVVGANGEVYVGWEQFFPNWPKIELAFVKSTDGGNSFTSPQTIIPLTRDSGLFSLHTPVGAFAYPALATDISNSSYRGNLYVAYMDERNPNSEVDIFFSRSTDQGETWSSPLRINDDVLGNNLDQFYPWLSVNQDGVISAMFYDCRNDTANRRFDVYMTQSYDGGQTFTSNKRVTTVSSSYPLSLLHYSSKKTVFDPLTAYFDDKYIAASPLAGPIGEYIGISSHGSQNNLIWTDTREGYQAIYHAKVITKLLIPKLTSPQNSSIVNDTISLFSWKELSYYDTASSYQLQYSLDKNFLTGVITFDSLTDTTFTLPDSLALTDSTYYWRVQSYNVSGDSSGYQDMPFSFTIDIDVPAVPLLISPVDTTSDSTPLFTWNLVTTTSKLPKFKPQVTSPVRYTWQLAQDTDFTINLLEVANLAANSHQLPDSQALDTGLIYYWRVRAYDLAGNQGSFGSPLQFRVLKYLRGDVNTDLKRNLADIIYLVNYVFKGGPVPIPKELGDVNCSEGSPNLVDIIYMVNYVFKGGAAPCT